MTSRPGMLTGARCLFRGISMFYRTPRYWHFAVIPALLLGVFYCAVIWFAFWLVPPWISAMLPEPDGGAWDWLIHTAVWLGTILTGVTLLIFVAGTVSGFYEITGAFFFDRLTVRFERDIFQLEPASSTLREQLGWIRHGVLFGLATMLLSIALLVSGFFLPLFGQLLAMTVIGYRIGVSSLFAVAAGRAIRAGALPDILRGKRAAVFGFGVTAWLLLLIPFSAPFLLPGFVLGGALLFHEPVIKEG